MKKMNEKAGKWVILKGDEIIEQDDSLEKIYSLAKKYNSEDITVSQIHNSEYYFY